MKGNFYNVLFLTIKELSTRQLVKIIVATLREFILVLIWGCVMKKNYIVSKANNLITSKYKLSLQEQRIILALVSMIDSKNHTKFHEYEMTTKEFAELLNVENTNHTYFKKITKQLMEKVIEIEDDQKVLQIHWLSTCTYYKGTGKIKLELHRELIPYLLQLKEQFTTYYLSNVLQMKSKYSIRLYEILKAQQFKKRFEIEIEKLRGMLGAEKYDRYSNLNQKILKPAITEINRQTDIFVHHVPHKEGSKVISIEFEIINKRKIEQELYGGE